MVGKIQCKTLHKHSNYTHAFFNIIIIKHLDFIYQLKQNNKPLLYHQFEKGNYYFLLINCLSS